MHASPATSRRKATDPRCPRVLWYTLGDRFDQVDDAWCMTGDPDATTSFIVASEPLTLEPMGWTELPESPVLTVRKRADGHAVTTMPLDA